MTLELFVAFDKSLREREQFEVAENRFYELFKTISSKNLIVDINVTYIWTNRTETVTVSQGKSLDPFKLDLATARVSTSHVVGQISSLLQTQPASIGDKYVLIFGAKDLKLEPSAKALSEQIDGLVAQHRLHFIAIGNGIEVPILHKPNMIFATDWKIEEGVVQEIAESVVAADLATRRINGINLQKDEPRENDSPAPSLQESDAKNSEDASVVPVEIAPIQLTHRLANQTAGTSFEIKVDELSGHTIHKSFGLPSGCVFSTESLMLAGIADNAEEIVWHVNSTNQGKFYIHEFKIEVNPDPKTLWKILPSDSEAKFHKADAEFKFSDTGSLLVAGGSIRGRSHENVGLHRDDDFSIQVATQNGWSVFSVADGAGSSKYSRRGSQIAVEVAPQILLQRLNDDFEQHLPVTRDFVGEVSLRENLELRNAMYSAFVAGAFSAAKAIEGEAEKSELSVTDLYTTLILVAMKKFNDFWFIGSFSIGDGAAGVVWANGEKFSPLSKSDEGEYAGQTKFLTSEQFTPDNTPWERLHLVKVPSFDGIALMTDGVSDPKLERKGVKSAAIWKSNVLDDWAMHVIGDRQQSEAHRSFGGESAAKFKEWLSFWARGSHDDRTLLIVLPKEN